ncbi:MAG: serine/threonine-protein kinase [Gaiellaceae bacterium]
MAEGAMASQLLDNDTEFAAYHIEGLLGRGGMSEVYRASNPRLDNTIALKLLARELAGDQLFRERFIRESRLAASLNHPNVVPIFDAGECDGRPYIAMRYVEGPDLKELLTRRGALSADYALSVVGQVAAALDCAHRKGLVHRDVKPGNILIDENAGDGTRPHVYLADFGVAKHRQSQSGLTSKGQYVGTIDYIAPEQIEGKELSGATDIYSLGCVLYECLTGAPPFDHDSDVAMIYAHLTEAAPAPSAKQPDLPTGVDEVIAKALAKRPEDRYRSCRELVDAARAAFEARPAGATLPAVSLGQMTVPSTRLAPETVLAGSGNGADREAPIPPEPVGAPTAATPPTAAPPTALATDPLISEQPGPSARTDRDTARNRPVWRARRRLVIAAVGVLVLGGAAGAATLMSSSGKKHGVTNKTRLGGHSSGNLSGNGGDPTLARRHSKGGVGTPGHPSKTATILKQRRKTHASSTGSGSTNTALNNRRSTSSSSSSSGSTSNTLNSRRSSSSSSSSSGSTSNTLNRRRTK